MFIMEMKELITVRQADCLMLAVLVAAPLIGLAWGVAVKRVRYGLAWGAGIGIGNFLMWHAYNAITDRLGLDTVKNLLVNLGLFVAVGLIGGIAAGLAARRRSEQRDAG